MNKNLKLSLLIFIICSCNFENYQSKINNEKKNLKKFNLYRSINSLTNKIFKKSYSQKNNLNKSKRNKFKYKIKPYQLISFILLNSIKSTAAINNNNDTCTTDDTELIAFFPNCCPDGWERYQRSEECFRFHLPSICELVTCRRVDDPREEIKNDIEELRDWVLGLLIGLIVVSIVSFFCCLGLWAK